MKSTIELLAPAGNKDNFIGAINAGANAIYLAGKKFGARASAINFNEQEIKEMIEYAHIRNVKVFVTVNTIIFENEIEELLTYTDFLVRNNVDALIVQDIGIIELFVKRYPNTEIHASTQMNVYKVNQAQYLKDIGVKRIILARETNIETIKKIKAAVDIDLEVFIHGALCVSYSGNCLFSALNGGRSGNRGECAQPCRLPYVLLKDNMTVSENAYLLSTKDLLSIDDLDEIISSGVASLKIEGRLRSFEYVTETVRTYKEAINNIYEQKKINRNIKNLKTVFNREYTKGYINNEIPFNINNSYRPNHQGIEVGVVTQFDRGKTTIMLSDSLSKNDGIRILSTSDKGGKVNKITMNGITVESAFKGDEIVIDMVGPIEVGSIVRKTLSSSLNESTRKFLDTNYKLIKISITITSFVGKKLTITVKNNLGNEIKFVSDFTIEKATNNPTSKSQIIEQVSKLGNTIYQLEEISVESDEEGFLPKSILNKLRRDGLQKLEQELLTKENRIINDSMKISLKPNTYHQELVVKVENTSQYQVAKELGIKTIYYKENSNNNYVFMNRINDDSVTNDKLVIQDFGLVNSDKEIITNEHLNVVNSFSVQSLLSKGVQSVTLSQESTFKNTKSIIKRFRRIHGFDPNLEIILYSTPDLMISKYCPITKSLGINKLNCGICEVNQYYLKDSKNNKYPLIRDSKCNIRVLHSKALNEIRNIKSYLDIGIKRIRLDFTTESKELTKSIIKQYQNEFKKFLNQKDM